MPDDIDRQALFQPDALGCLMAMLVEEAPIAMAEARDCGQAAVTHRTQSFAAQARYSGGREMHRCLEDALECTGDPGDILTLAEIAEAITASGGKAPDHAVLGKEIREMWDKVVGGRIPRDGRQQRAIRGVRVKTTQSDGLLDDGMLQ